jgi:hypothetical protein
MMTESSPAVMWAHVITNGVKEALNIIPMLVGDRDKTTKHGSIACSPIENRILCPRNTVHEIL